MNLDDIVVRTEIYSADGTKLSYSQQVFIEHTGGEFGNNLQMINGDGDLELIVFTTKVERATQHLSQRLSKTDSQDEGKKNALESPNLPERKV